MCLWGDRGGTIDDFADDLMAENQRFLDEGKVAFVDVEVGAADSAGEDAEKGVARDDGRDGNVFDLERLVGGVEDSSFHR